MTRPARVFVEADGTVWEPSEEAWRAIEKLTGHETEDDRVECADVRGYATDPGERVYDFMGIPVRPEGEDSVERLDFGGFLTEAEFDRAFGPKVRRRYV